MIQISPGRRLFSFIKFNIGSDHNLSNLPLRLSFIALRWAIQHHIPFNSELGWDDIERVVRDKEKFYIWGDNLDKWTDRQPIWRKILKIRNKFSDFNDHIIGKLLEVDSWPDVLCDEEEWEDFLKFSRNLPGKDQNSWIGDLIHKYAIFNSFRIFENPEEVRMINLLWGGREKGVERTHLEEKALFLFHEYAGLSTDFNSLRGNGLKYVFNTVVCSEERNHELYEFRSFVHVNDSVRDLFSLPDLVPGRRLLVSGEVKGEYRDERRTGMWTGELQVNWIKLIT
jgi:hypothetical protein